MTNYVGLAKLLKAGNNNKNIEGLLGLFFYFFLFYRRMSHRSDAQDAAAPEEIPNVTHNSTLEPNIIH